MAGDEETSRNREPREPRFLQDTEVVGGAPTALKAGASAPRMAGQGWAPGSKEDKGAPIGREARLLPTKRRREMLPAQNLHAGTADHLSPLLTPHPAVP